MKYTKFKIILAAICVIVAITGPVAARWTLPISPGDNVIDFSRLSKNISELTEMIKTAQNYANIVKNTTMMNLGDNLDYLLGEYNSVSNKVSEAIKNAKSAINFKYPNAQNPELPSNTISDISQYADKYLQDIDKNTEARIKDSLTLNQASLQANIKASKEINKILQRANDGVLAEKQHLNATEILNAQIDLDKAQELAVKYIHELTKQNEDNNKQKILDAQKKSLLFPIYDPMKNDAEHRKGNVGFGKF